MLRWWRSRRDADLDDEIQAHFGMAVAERVARGQPADEAAAEVRREFGNVGLVKETTRAMWSGASLEPLIQDVRHAVRGLRRSPGFAIVALLTLALGIGANTAVFTVVNGVLLRPLPFHRPDRLFAISYMPTTGFFAGIPPALLDGNYVELRRRDRLFQSFTTFNSAQVTLTGAGEAERIAAANVTSEFLSVLGVAPALGRGFAPNDGQPGREQLVLLGDGLWRSRFAADRAIIGRTITLDGTPFTVVGVMPPSFDFPFEAQLWTPFEVRLQPNRARWRPVVGRLREGATQEQAHAELRSISVAFGRPGFDHDERLARVTPVETLLVGDVKTSLLVFTGAVGFVLLIGCANVANLMLMRAMSRQHDVGLRMALGASRGRLVRQMLTESVVVGLVGGALGVIIAVIGVQTLLALAPPGRIPRVDQVHLDGWVLAFTAAVALGTGLLFGSIPALQATRRAPRESLRMRGRSMSRPSGGIRHALAVAEIALALVLLAGAGLMVRSFLRMRDVELGFRPERVMAMTVDLPETAYRTAPEMVTFHDRVIAELARIPGVTNAAAVNYRPLDQALTSGDFRVDGASRPPGFVVGKPAVSADYFQTMGIRLLAGRVFTDDDDLRAPGVVVISEGVARAVWPNESAIGKRISMYDTPTKPEHWLTVVGVVNDVIQEGLTKAPTAAIYQPVRQITGTYFLGHMGYVVRTAVGAGDIAPAMRAVIRGIDQDQPVLGLGTMDALIGETIAEPVFQMRLLAMFSLLALALAAIGTYGVLAYGVSERTREIGIRVALGATTRQVSSMVVRRTLALAGIGLVVGTLGAIAVTRVLRQFLFRVSPNDPTTLVTVAGVLLVVAMAAGFLPARRATRVDPMVALRAD
jgi:predicted permease